MRAILVLLLAFGAAFLFISALKSWQVKKALRTGQTTDSIENNYILGAFIAAFIFIFCVWWLEADSGSPNMLYSPAKIENGTVIGGAFEK